MDLYREKPLNSSVTIPTPAHTPPPSLRKPTGGIESPVSLEKYGTNRLSLGSWSTHHKSIKYGRGKYSETELVPQPTDDANDPLNWRQWRKDLNLASLLFMVGLVGSMKTAFLSTSATMAVRFNVSYTAVAALTATPLLLSAVTGFASSILARIFGKRPLYLLGTLITLIGAIWNSTAGNSFTSCIGARLVQGLGWGVFDTLVTGSIHDTYFGHERHSRIVIYNVFNFATTWGSPLIGGALSSISNSFTIQFRIISALYIIAIPLIALAAPETVFDRAQASEAPTPVSGFTLSRRWQPWRVRHRLTQDRVKDYLHDMQPCTFMGPITRPIVLQAPKAFVAPTTILIFMLTFIPICALWGLAFSVSLLLAPAPINASSEVVGAIMTGTWVLPTLVVIALSLRKGDHQKFTPIAHCITVAAGSFLVLTGILTFALGTDNFMLHKPYSSSSSLSSRLDEKRTSFPSLNNGVPFFATSTATMLNLPLLSFQLGVLAAGVAALDAATRPLIARSTSFTSSSMAIAIRISCDMNTGIISLRSFATGVFILVIPAAISSTGGLKAIAIGLSVAQVVIALVLIVVRWFFDESIWRADGKVMGLVDLSSLKLSVSFFDTTD